MQVGVMVSSHNHLDWPRLLQEDYSKLPEVPDVQIIDESIELGAMVEPLGFDSIWCAEHYGSAYSMNTNPLMWLAYWAARTERIDVGSAVVVAPWWQPMKLAHEIAMLDVLLKGRRFHLGIGRGVSAHEYAAFGISREESRVRFQEMIEILKLADENERTPHYKGEIYDVPPFSVRPRPRHKGHLFDNIKAAFNTPASMEVAAELGLGQMFVAAETADKMISQVAKFNAIRAQRGLAPNQPTTMLYLHCTTDPEEIERGRLYTRQQGWAARNHYAIWNNPNGFEGVKGYENYADFFPKGELVDGAENVDPTTSEYTDLIGPPEEIFEKIKKLQELISLDYLIVHPKHGAKPLKAAQDSLELFAKEVLPAVQALPTPLHEHNRGTEEDLKAEVSVGGAVS